MPVKGSTLPDLGTGRELPDLGEEVDPETGGSGDSMTEIAPLTRAEADLISTTIYVDWSKTAGSGGAGTAANPYAPGSIPEILVDTRVVVQGVAMGHLASTSIQLDINATDLDVHVISRHLYDSGYSGGRALATDAYVDTEWNLVIGRPNIYAMDITDYFSGFAAKKTVANTVPCACIIDPTTYEASYSFEQCRAAVEAGAPLNMDVAFERASDSWQANDGTLAAALDALELNSGGCLFVGDGVSGNTHTVFINSPSNPNTLGVWALLADNSNASNSESFRFIDVRTEAANLRLRLEGIAISGAGRAATRGSRMFSLEMGSINGSVAVADIYSCLNSATDGIAFIQQNSGVQNVLMESPRGIVSIKGSDELGVGAAAVNNSGTPHDVIWSCQPEGLIIENTPVVRRVTGATLTNSATTFSSIAISAPHAGATIRLEKPMLYNARFDFRSALITLADPDLPPDLADYTGYVNDGIFEDVVQSGTRAVIFRRCRFHKNLLQGASSPTVMFQANTAPDAKYYIDCDFLFYSTATSTTIRAAVSDYRNITSSTFVVFDNCRIFGYAASPSSNVNLALAYSTNITLTARAPTIFVRNTTLYGHNMNVSPLWGGSESAGSNFRILGFDGFAQEVAVGEPFQGRCNIWMDGLDVSSFYLPGGGSGASKAERYDEWKEMLDSLTPGWSNAAPTAVPVLKSYLEPTAPFGNYLTVLPSVASETGVQALGLDSFDGRSTRTINMFGPHGNSTGGSGARIMLMGIG